MPHGVNHQEPPALAFSVFSDDQQIASFSLRFQCLAAFSRMIGILVNSRQTGSSSAPVRLVDDAGTGSRQTAYLQLASSYVSRPVLSSTEVRASLPIPYPASDQLTVSSELADGPYLSIALGQARSIERFQLFYHSHTACNTAFQIRRVHACSSSFQTLPTNSLEPVRCGRCRRLLSSFALEAALTHLRACSFRSCLLPVRFGSRTPSLE